MVWVVTFRPRDKIKVTDLRDVHKHLDIIMLFCLRGINDSQELDKDFAAYFKK